VCLAAHGDDEVWLWHAWFGHLSFDTLTNLARLLAKLSKSSSSHTPSILIKHVILDKVSVKHWEYKS
jgi:hypothetical protein